MRANTGDNYNKLITHTTLKTPVEICIQWHSRFCTKLIENAQQNHLYLTQKKGYIIVNIFSPLRRCYFAFLIKGHLIQSEQYRRYFAAYRGHNCVHIVHLNIKSLGNYSGIYPSLITGGESCKNDCC